MAIAQYNPFYRPALTASAFLADQFIKTNQRQQMGRSLTRTMNKRKRTVPRRMSFKKAVLNVKPAKHLSGESSVTINHNQILTCIPSQAITQGTGNTQRDGDAIYLAALKLRVNCQAAAASNGYTFRVLVGWTGEEYTTANIATTLVASVTAAELFLPTTTTFWMPNAQINPKAFTILHDQTYDINSQVASTSDVISDSYTVPINQNFEYQSTGSVQGKTRNLCIIAIGSVVGGSSGVTGVGNVVASWDLIFK